MQRPRGGGHAGGARRKPAWWRAKERGVRGEAEGAAGARMGVLLDSHCLGKKNLAPRPSSPGEALVWVFIRGLPRSVQCLC